MGDTATGRSISPSNLDSVDLSERMLKEYPHGSQVEEQSSPPTAGGLGEMMVKAGFDALVLGVDRGSQEKQDTLASVGLSNTVDTFWHAFKRRVPPTPFILSATGKRPSPYQGPHHS
jgi:hypothetical protein